MPVSRVATVALLALGLALVAACAPGPAVRREGPTVEAPTYRVGDRWAYKARDGFSLPVTWDEVHEVTAVGPDGITIRVTQQGPTVNNERIEKLVAPGLLRQGAVFDAETRVFPEPLVRYQFPMKPGDSWRALVENTRVPPAEFASYSRAISHWVSVDGWSTVTTPAGTFEAMRLHITMQLDDETPFRWPTQVSHFVWYAPAVRGIVLAHKEAFYYEKSTPSPNRIRSQNALVELISFAPGPGPR